MSPVADRWTWWQNHRRAYNLWLVVAGLTAYTAYCAVVWSNCPAVDTAEITVFTAVAQGIGYLFAMALANVCYFLGPVSEKLLRPTNLERYRLVTFSFGVAFSIALPFLVPTVAYFTIERCS